MRRVGGGLGAMGVGGVFELVGKGKMGDVDGSLSGENSFLAASATTNAVSSGIASLLRSQDMMPACSATSRPKGGKRVEEVLHGIIVLVETVDESEFGLEDSIHPDVQFHRHLARIPRYQASSSSAGWLRIRS